MHESLMNACLSLLQSRTGTSNYITKKIHPVHQSLTPQPGSVALNVIIRSMHEKTALYSSALGRSLSIYRPITVAAMHGSHYQILNQFVI